MQETRLNDEDSFKINKSGTALLPCHPVGRGFRAQESHSADGVGRFRGNAEEDMPE